MTSPDEQLRCDTCQAPLTQWIGNEHGKFCSQLCAETDAKCRSIHSGARFTGAAAGAMGSGQNYADNVVFHAQRGHGFAAEKANHLHDVLTGKDAQHKGPDQVKNGADRVVDGVQIQTKYCRTGSDCIRECFDKASGEFRYFNQDGTPMQIEVPSDKHEAAVQALKDRISKGQVRGVTDPKEAEQIVRKGHYTYEQVRNIAKFGTIESLTYDALNGIKLAGTAMGISAAISFAHALWNGDDFEKALKSACYSGLQVGGVAWISSIAVAQVGRTGLEQSMRAATDYAVKAMGPKVSALIVNGIRGTSLSGAAAMSSASKLLRGNVVTGVITTAVLSSVDVGRLVQGKISGAQAFKNITNTAAGVAGGTGGWVAGAAAGAAIGSAVPLVGTAVGGIVGGLLGAFVGGSAASSASKTVLDKFIEDDAQEMMRILQREFERLAYDFLLSEREIDAVVKALGNLEMPAELRKMYASDHRRAYAVSLVKPLIVKQISARSVTLLPSGEQLMTGARGVLEALA